MLSRLVKTFLGAIEGCIKGGGNECDPTRLGSAQKVVDRELGDFPRGPVVENPPCNAGDMGSIPSLETKILHAVGQWGLCQTMTEPLL